METEKHSLECKYCGAPLSIRDGETVVKCEYCGMSTVIEAPKGVSPLLGHAFMLLENGRFEDADADFEQVLKQAPKNTEAHLGKLMVEFGVKTREQMKGYVCLYEYSENYKNLLKYGSGFWVDTVKNNNFAAAKYELNRCRTELAKLRQSNAAIESELKNRIEKIRPTIKRRKMIKILLVIVAIAAFSLINNLSSFWSKISGTFVEIFFWLLHPIAVVSLIVVIFMFIEDRGGNKNSKLLIEAENNLARVCESNRNAEKEWADAIERMQRIVDAY